MRVPPLALALLVSLMTAEGVRADTLATTGSPSPASAFTLDETFVSGVPMLTDLRWLPDGRLILITKDGGAFIRPSAGGALVPAGTFDVDTEAEKGLVGVAVHPDFVSNGELFFYYALSDASGGTDADRNRVVKRVLDAGDQLGPETVLLGGIRGPDFHDGGALDVGPDGLLYVGVGDSGCDSGQVAEPPYTPTNFYGTCLSDHAAGLGGTSGKILRIGLDGSIPASNPLVGAGDVTACGDGCGVAISPDLIGPPRPEVWAWGFRNPFRLWADPQTGLVWVGDVGEVSYEEVTIVAPGRHHGWPWREADHGHPASACTQVRVGTDGLGAAIMDQDCVDPVYRCRHDEVNDPAVDGDCNGVIGGPIVDSCDWPEAFRGRYFFADIVNGKLWSISPTPARDGIAGPRQDFGAITDGIPVSLRVGNDGALYVAVLNGRVVRIAPQSPVPCGTTTTTTVSESSTTTTSGPESTSTTSTVAGSSTTTSTSSDSSTTTSTTSDSSTTTSTVSDSSTTTSTSAESTTTTTVPEASTTTSTGTEASTTSTTGSESTTTSSTTLESSTSTTSVPVSTTTTTLPSPCAAWTGLEHLDCEIGATRGAPLCDDPIEPTLTLRLLGKLDLAHRLLVAAKTETRPRRLEKLLDRVDRAFAAIARATARGARRSRVTPPCDQAVAVRTAELRTLLARLRPLRLPAVPRLA